MDWKISANSLARYTKSMDLPSPKRYEILRSFFNLPYESLADLLASL